MRGWDGNGKMDDSQADRGRDQLDNSDVHALDEGKNQRWYEYQWEIKTSTSTYYILNITVNKAKILKDRLGSGSQGVLLPVVH